MLKRGPSTSVDTLDTLTSANAELTQEVERLRQIIESQAHSMAELEARMDQYWELHEDIDYRSLVTRIREEARNVGDVLQALDTGTRRKLARLGATGTSADGNGSPSSERLLPTVHSLLRTLNEWK